MDNKSQTKGPLAKVLDELGGKSGLVTATLEILNAAGKVTRGNKPYSRFTVYDVIGERYSNADVEEAFLQAAENESRRREEVAARAAKVVAKVSA